MDSNLHTNTCYVFSRTTLGLAIDAWTKENKDNKTKNSEERNDEYLIAAAAIPWFLKHLNDSESIHMFTHDDLITELDVWSLAQVAEYPHQKKRIEKTCRLITQFFKSDIVLEHKMVVDA